MNKTQKVALSLTSLITLTTLSGCGPSYNENEINNEPTETEIVQTFNEGEHLIKYIEDTLNFIKEFVKWFLL